MVICSPTDYYIMQNNWEKLLIWGMMEEQTETMWFL